MFLAPALYLVDRHENASVFSSNSLQELKKLPVAVINSHILCSMVAAFILTVKLI